ncbi:hypothetical protein L9F63_016012, partial [Diploptera punctata]
RKLSLRCTPYSYVQLLNIKRQLAGSRVPIYSFFKPVNERDTSRHYEVTSDLSLFYSSGSQKECAGIYPVGMSCSLPTDRSSELGNKLEKVMIKTLKCVSQTRTNTPAQRLNEMDQNHSSSLCWWTDKLPDQIFPQTTLYRGLLVHQQREEEVVLPIDIISVIKMRNREICNSCTCLMARRSVCRIEGHWTSK